MLSAAAVAAGAGAGAELRSLAAVAGPQHESMSAVKIAAWLRHVSLLRGVQAHLGFSVAATIRLGAGVVLCRPPLVLLEADCSASTTMRPAGGRCQGVSSCEHHDMRDQETYAARQAPR